VSETTAALHGVSKRYGAITAVRDLDLALHPGEVVALIGHNGAGKTTQVKMLLGLARPSAGRVELLGADPAADGFALRRHVGYLPESVSFHLALTGRETLAFYARLKGVDPRRLDPAFEAVGLDGAADRPVGAYSKGMRQRLGLAQALLGNPRVLFLDEPTSGLDPGLRRDFYAIVSALAARGTTCLLASHALTEIEGCAHRVVIVDRGAKIADGTLDALRAIARLPVRVRLRPTGAFSEPGWQRLADGSVATEVAPDAKIALLARLLADPAAVSDISVSEPTLDDLYTHFLRREAA
jgi:Cu-processing system ATP-binding protein